MGKCERSRCDGHGDAIAYEIETDDAGDPLGVEYRRLCRTHALQEQMSGDPPAAVTWTRKVEVELDP